MQCDLHHSTRTQHQGPCPRVERPLACAQLASYGLPSGGSPPSAAAPTGVLLLSPQRVSVVLRTVRLPADRLPSLPHGSERRRALRCCAADRRSRHTRTHVSIRVAALGWDGHHGDCPAHARHRLPSLPPRHCMLVQLCWTRRTTLPPVEACSRLSCAAQGVIGSAFPPSLPCYCMLLQLVVDMPDHPPSR